MIRIHRRPLRWAAISVLALASTVFSGCASFYVDNGLREADTAQVTKPASPKPVQLFFSFQTKGSPNAQATQHLRAQVSDLVKQSGLFSEIRDAASPDVGVLQLTINNVALSNDAVGKGVMTGLTLGLVGSTVGDGYVCDLQYRPSDSAPRIFAQSHHALYTSLGASSGPDAAATKVASISEAVTTIVRQSVKSLLVKLSNNPQFQGTP